MQPIVSSGRIEYCQGSKAGCYGRCGRCIYVFVCIVCAQARLGAFVQAVEWVALQHVSKPLHQHLLSSDQLA